MRKTPSRSIFLFCDLLVTEEGECLTTGERRKSKEEEALELQLMEDAQRSFEQRCAAYTAVFHQHSESDHDDEDGSMYDGKKRSSSSSDSEGSVPTSTDSDSPYGSDSESSSSYDEYYAARELPKKKVHRHAKGPVKLCIKEILDNGPKYRYRKYRRKYMKKHGIQVSYGNIHTKEIKQSLKKEKHERHKADAIPQTIIHMMEGLAKQSAFLTLDPQHPLLATSVETKSTSLTKLNEDELTESKPTSSLQKMKQKISKSIKRTRKTSSQLDVPEGGRGRSLSNSDAASSIASVDDEAESII